MKVCKGCHINKPLTSYGVSNAVKSGKTSRCKECHSKRGKARYQKIQDEFKAILRQKRIDNPEHRRNIERKSRARNKEKNRPAKNARQSIRNRILNGDRFLILDKELKKIYQSPCFACGSESNQSLDHLIPLSRGGSHSVGNIITLCLSCNTQKHNKTLTEWRKTKSHITLK